MPTYGAGLPAADGLFDADLDELDQRGSASRDHLAADEGPWDSDSGSDRESDSDSDIWGTVDQDSDVHDVDMRDLGDADDSDTEDSDIEDSDSHDQADFTSDRDTASTETRGEAGPERDKRKGRRRRRRRGGRDRAADSSGSEDIADDLPVGRRDEPASLESDRRGEVDGLDDSDDDADIDHHSHRGIPSWGDAIGFIIDANMEGRARSPKNGPARGRRGGRGRSSSPRRGRDDNRS